jgi:hypothetical protein
VARRAFTVTTTVRLDPVHVVDLLADLPRHVGVHPFLVSAVPIGQGRDTAGSWTDWQVTERPGWWRLRYRVRFVARVVRTSQTSIHTRVALPGCRLVSTTVAHAEAGGARVVEETTVDSPRPLIGYVARQAERAHRLTFSMLLDLAAPGN